MAEHCSRDEHWADMVTQWRASGLSQKKFCRRQAISKRASHNWLYKSPYRDRVARILAGRSRETPLPRPPDSCRSRCSAKTEPSTHRRPASPQQIINHGLRPWLIILKKT